MAPPGRISRNLENQSGRFSYNLELRQRLFNCNISLNQHSFQLITGRAIRKSAERSHSNLSSRRLDPFQHRITFQKRSWRTPRLLSKGSVIIYKPASANHNSKRPGKIPASSSKSHQASFSILRPDFQRGTLVGLPVAPYCHFLLLFVPKSRCHNNTKFQALPGSSPLPLHLPIPPKVETATSHPSLALPAQDETNPQTVSPKKPSLPQIPASRSVLELAAVAQKLPPSFLEPPFSHLLPRPPPSLPRPLPRPQMDTFPPSPRLHLPPPTGEISVARRARWVLSQSTDTGAPLSIATKSRAKRSTFRLASSHYTCTRVAPRRLRSTLGCSVR